MPKQSILIYLLVLIALLFSMSIPSKTLAAPLAQVLKRAARISDDVPVKMSDDLLGNLRKLPILRPSSEALESASKATLRNPDDLHAAAVLIDGARRLDNAVPDLALRSDLIRRRGNDVFQSAGLRADAASDLVYLDRYLQRTDLQVPEQLRRPTMADFSAVAADDSRWKFWQQYVVPNKKLWAGGSALAVYLVAPEMWHDHAGNLTEKGIALAADLGGDLLAGALRGIREGGEALGDKVSNELSPLVSSSLAGWIGMLTLIGIFAIMVSVGLRRRLVKWIRKYVIGTSTQQTDANTF